MVDWESVERDYRAGALSVREIGRRHKVTESAIRKKAIKEAWMRDLSGQVREAARSKLVIFDGGAQGASKANAREIVGQASDELVRTALLHRSDVRALRTLAARYQEKLEDDDELSLPQKALVLEILARTQSRLIPLERQAYRMDEDPGATEGVAASIVEIAKGVSDRLLGEGKDER